MRDVLKVKEIRGLKLHHKREGRPLGALPICRNRKKNYFFFFAVFFFLVAFLAFFLAAIFLIPYFRG
jgi:hypothetical protein